MGNGAQREDIKAAVIQFLKFSIVGVSNLFVSLLVYYVFVAINPRWYLIGNAVGWVLAVANSYLWNSRFTFTKTETSTAAKLIRVFAAYGLCLFLSMALLFLQVDLLGISVVIAPIASLIITTPINFFLNKLWVFKK
jgi:putative flippase GtrA